ncbi:MAG: hypothetical protein AAFV85_26970 [Cyanobacteria bacterium J06634_6]
MKTLTQSALEFRVANPSQTGIYANDEVIGLIQTHPELGPNRWEYRSYGDWENSFIGTYEECLALAEAEYLELTPEKVSETPVNLNGTLLVYVETVRAALSWWYLLHDTKTPCIIWKKGQPDPWAAFPLSRLLAEA